MAGAFGRWAGGLLPGARTRRAQIVGHAAIWRQLNAEALRREGPLWVALGDSTAQSIGATSIDEGYVMRVLRWLQAERDPMWRVVNLSVSGARVADVVDQQLPALADLPAVELVTCAAGANDLLRTPLDRLLADLGRLGEAVPEGSFIATMPQGLRTSKAHAANATVREVAARRSLGIVDLWATTGPPWRGRFAADGFHPNDSGYVAWSRAFIDAFAARS